MAGIRKGATDDSPAGPAITDSLPNYVADELRSMITRGTILPGEHLRQTQLADRFGRSKVPIREALKLLSAEGFLMHDRNRGYFVAPLEIEEARQLYKMRRWIEGELLGTAEWPDDTQIRQFYEQFDRIDSMDQNKDYRSWAKALEDLRYSLFDLSPQKVLLREAARLWRLTDRYRTLLPRNPGSSPERKLIDALAARDRKRLLSDYIEARKGIESRLEQVFERP
jgi:DNA-binding GntR family transcriptional regulator